MGSLIVYEPLTKLYLLHPVAVGGMLGDGPHPGDQEGWASWAWSYVPQILPSGEEEDGDESGPRRKPQLPVLTLGFYIKQASLAFKVSHIYSTIGYRFAYIAFTIIQFSAKR